ncbi:hypothetical protein BHE74_00010168 [Ensete ventricosum]|nr:hypothetical protein GW17_00021269 [Ensete ventricosum]RWW81426.1 hypothetical protein BHE74_00010168 [Ensete ventricosum]
MDDENEARNFSYRLEVSANGRKLIWEGTPRSIRDGHCKVRDSHDGLIIQRNMALFFSGSDRKGLKLRVTGPCLTGKDRKGFGRSNRTVMLEFACQNTAAETCLTR